MASSKKPSIQWGDKGDDLIRIIKKAITYGDTPKAERTVKMAKKAAGQMKSQKKVVRSGKTLDAISEATKARTERFAQQRKFKAIADKERLIAKHEKTLRATRLGDAVESKGSKLVGGKEMALGKKRAEGAITQGRRAGAASKAGNARRKAEQQELGRQIRAAKGPEKYRLKQKLRAHEEKYGRFK